MTIGEGRVASVLHVFDITPVKMAGAAVLIFLLGYAAGNHHKTEAALTGQAQYFQQHEKQHVEVQKQIDKKVIPEQTRKEDAAVIGVPAPVLKHAVDVAKGVTPQ